MTEQKNLETLRKCVEAEIVALHNFISGWIRGEIEASKSVFDERFTKRLAASMINIQPLGKVLTRDELVASIYDGHGANAAFEIEIKDCEVRYLSDDQSSLLATYVEYQSGAVQTDPPENVRFSSVVFEMSGSGKPELWMHIHETGLPN